MSHEKTQSGNPHKLTIKQHIFPAASIVRFAQEDGYVAVYLQEQQKIVPLKPTDELFCAERAWNQAAERGFMRKIETAFQKLAEQILTETFDSILGFSENRIISEFYALCRLRDEVKQSPPQDVQIKNVLPENTLTKNQEEILENKGYIFARGSTMLSRHLASIRIRTLLDRLCEPETTWAIIYSREIEFIVPDSFREIGIVPISKNYCLVANHVSGEISSDNAIEINRIAVNNSLKYYFAHDLTKCGL